MAKKILLGAEYSVLEPLALFYLSAVAKSEGVESKIVFGRGPQYPEWREALSTFQPDFLGLSVYTGHHAAIKKFLKDVVKPKYPTLEVIVGGPHATFFPRQVLDFADYVVVGEGFGSLRKILKGEAPKGILLPLDKEQFPKSDRDDFYKEYPEHLKNRIKNVIAGTGCPYMCSYCYNSANFDENPDFDESQKKLLLEKYPHKRFFPLEQRPVQDFVDEISDVLRLSPETEFFYFQDDVFGSNLDWLKEFVSKASIMDISFHANTRFEHIDPRKDSGKERIDLLKKAGCTGFSIAIESADPIICREVLSRNLDHDLVFASMNYLHEHGFKVRTNNMLGLPLGATMNPTKVNLEADLETLELNVKLYKEFGIPTFAWASTLAPYPGTHIDRYCKEHGFYENVFTDLTGEETYRIKSVLRHPRKWVGSELSSKTPEVWLSNYEEEMYRNQINTLMNLFPTFAKIPDGHKLAREFLEHDNLNFEVLNKAFRTHVYNKELFL
jgi:radical SAM superfamily enzyme YgiQ (UPF0313 family)